MVMRRPAYENMLLRACHCHSSHRALRSIPGPKPPTSWAVPLQNKIWGSLPASVQWLPLLDCFLQFFHCDPLLVTSHASLSLHISPLSSLVHSESHFKAWPALSCVFLLLCRSTTLSESCFPLDRKSFALHPLLHSPNFPKCSLFPLNFAMVSLESNHKETPNPIHILLLFQRKTGGCQSSRAKSRPKF